MKKSDLKSEKNFVKLRNGDICIVGHSHLVSFVNIICLCDYREDMIHETISDFDIMKVYDVEKNINIESCREHFYKITKMIKNNQIDSKWERV